MRWSCPYCDYEVEKERMQALRLAESNHLRKHGIDYQELKEVEK